MSSDKNNITAIFTLILASVDLERMLIGPRIHGWSFSFAFIGKNNEDNFASLVTVFFQKFCFTKQVLKNRPSVKKRQTASLTSTGVAA